MTQAAVKSFIRASMRPALVAVALGLAGLGCSRPLLERAIAARGGALQSLSRVSSADVYRGFPGDWSWRFDYGVPDRLRWTIETYGEEQSVSFDGRQVRYFLGSAALPEVPAALGDFGSIVRWTAVTTLDALADDPRARVRELPASQRPAGAAAALEISYDDGARYVLSFDDRDRLVAAEGPIAVPTVAAGRMHATYTGFAPTGGYELPATCTYTVDGEPFFRETVLRWVPNDSRLTPESFAGPPPKPR